MKTNFKYILGKAWLPIAAVLALGACSDKWDDHYEPETVNANSIWEAISTNDNLTNFAKVIKGCGYDRDLSGNQTYTVFALTNDALSNEQADSLVQAYQTQKDKGVRDDDNTVIKQFVKNHIALFTKPVSSLTNDTLRMMNGKYEPLTANSVGGQTFVTSNELHSNGLLYTLAHRISYYPNVFEYLGLDHDVDSVYNFLNSFTKYTFNPEASVPGGIVDGQTVYLDSVFAQYNNMLDQIGYINIEDSTYWMLVPTNDVWNKLKDEYHQYFNYASDVNKRDSLQETYTRLAILTGTIFNRSQNTDAALQDSAVSTQGVRTYFRREMGPDEYPYGIFYKPFASNGIFNGATNIECSNGRVLKTSDFRIKKEQTFMRTIKVEAENTLRQDTLMDAAQPLTTHEITSDNAFYDKLSSNMYVDVIAENTTDDENHFPQATIQYTIPDVLSNVPYDIYVVFAPPRAANPNIPDEDLLPSQVLVNLYWHNQDAKQNSRRLGVFHPNPTKVDTVLVRRGQKFPTCTSGLTTSTVKLRLQDNVQKNQTALYSPDMHIDCIIFKPQE